MVVAWLLDKRQNEVLTALENDSYTNNLNNSDDKDSVLSGSGLNGGQPVFQHILMNFLDHDAPVLDEAGSPQNKSQFTNLVHLFSELIRHDVFSHDAYMCCLISRGDLLTGAGGMLSLDSQGIFACTYCMCLQCICFGMDVCLNLAYHDKPIRHLTGGREPFEQSRVYLVSIGVRAPPYPDL